MKHVLIFKLEKETKGALRYQEVNEGVSPHLEPLIGTLYLRKSRLTGTPQGLEVTVDFDE